MFVNANDAIDWIHGARYKGQKNGLENTKALLGVLGNPQDSFRCVHIAGTNGKGSTAAYTEAVLRESGLRTGLYTSPYLIAYNERVQVCGVPINDAELVDIVNLLVEKTDMLTKNGVYPTTFELGTALAFEYFRRKKVEIAVVEVGLGGRFDSTNVITPDISMIAAIGLDHVKILGDTVEAIAFEKAGIIKPGVPVVVQEQAENILEVFRNISDERGSELTIAPVPDVIEKTPYGTRFALDGVEYRIGLSGNYQLKNASLAICALRKLGISEDAIVRGVEKAKWPCRLEWLKGVLIDGAHNPQGAMALREYIGEFFAGEKITLVTGMMHDKQINECAEILAPMCDYVIATAVDDQRAAAPEYLIDIYRELGATGEAISGVDNAVEAAMKRDGVKIFAGSLYIAGAARQYLAGDNCFGE
jgi:dihydrofolate synthase/folylpolyglutamate synthase